MKRGHILLLLAIVALGAFLRFYQITEIPPGLYPDEAMNGNNALEALATGQFKVFYPENNGREGLFINLQVGSLALFGNEPWALRVVSAVFGTLTILGIYLLTKELSVNKSQIPSAKSQTNSNDQDPKHFGIWNLEFGISRGEIIALLSSFFLAASYWHLNFSRIGFRAILVPFFATFAMYFLLKGLRRGNTFDLILAGIFAGLGFYTYIAFRFMALVFMVPIAWHLWQWRKEKRIRNQESGIRGIPCIPCAVVLFLFVVLVVSLPLGVYFIQNPQDFLNRAGEISIFSVQSPLKELGKSTLLTLGMFFVKGDCNWRHNFDCRPELHPIVAVFFLIGVLSLIWKKSHHEAGIMNQGERESSHDSYFMIHDSRSLAAWTLFVWIAAMALPAVLTRESVPHALRSIGMIPPVMILAALGAAAAWDYLWRWLAAQQQKWPTYTAQLYRIKKELIMLAALALSVIPFMTYRNYFIRWADHPETYAAFDTSSLNLGQFLQNLPPETKKYVIANTKGVIVRGIPMPAQAVMFATDTFGDEKRLEKNLFYLTRGEIDRIEVSDAEKVLVAVLDGGERETIRLLQQKFPTLKVRVPGGFVLLQNY